MKTLYLYVHTHWDREWYLPFEGFRTSLVDVARRIVRDLKIGQLPHFYFDGQSVIFEDILEIAPQYAEQFRQLMSEGRLSAGPWYVLADQMLVGGESLVRNLHIGLKETSRYGTPSKIGYCPDTFGHSQDLPRILSGFGILSTVIWRGVPRLDSPVFWWQSPDGSRVLAYHLTNGYYQTGFHELGGEPGGAAVAAGAAAKRGALEAAKDGLKKLTNELRSWVEVGDGDNGHISPYCSLVDGALHPVGADHCAPPFNFASTVEKINQALSADKVPLKAVSCSLTEYLERVQTALEKHKVRVGLLEGEMRDNSAAKQYARSYLLYGVLSTRLYLKRANRLAEYKLSRLWEPLLSSLHVRKKLAYPGQELRFAWKLLLKNHPHDSICGCSVDAVHDEMMVRFSRLDQLLSVIEKAAENASAGKTEEEPQSPRDPDFGTTGLRIYNTANQSVSAPVPLSWFQKPGQRLPVSDLVQLEAREPCDQLFAGWGEVPYYKLVDGCQGWVWAQDVPAHGSRSISWPAEKPAAARAEKKRHAGAGNPAPPAVPVSKAHGRAMSNGLLHLSVEGDGTLVVTSTLPGRAVHSYRLAHKLRDTGDGGDSYNYDPLPRDKPLYARFESVNVKRRGPLVSTLEITYSLDIPEGIVEPERLQSSSHKAPVSKAPSFRRSRTRVSHKITTEVSLYRGLPIVFFNTRWNNQARDHRLEVVFDTGSPVHTSHSENHFSLVRRSHFASPRGKSPLSELPVAEATEAVPDRFPCQRFFIANGQLFLNSGLPEYGVERSTVTYTVLRAMSYLSRPRLRTRGGGAGPSLPVPGSNCLGENLVSYGWAPLSVPKRAGSNDLLTDELIVEACSLAEQYEGSLYPLLERGDAGEPDRLYLLDNPAVRCVAQFVEDDGRTLVLRLLNVAQSKQKVRINPRFRFQSAAACWLNLEVISPVVFNNDQAELHFGANELKTLRFALSEPATCEN